MSLMPSSQRIRPTWVAGWLLALHLITGTGWLPLATAGLAALDGQHRVLLSVTPGLANVVLAHSEDPTAPPDRRADHEHRSVSRLLSLLAMNPQAEPDHLLRLLSASELRSLRGTALVLPRLVGTSPWAGPRPALRPDRSALPARSVAAWPWATALASAGRPVLLQI